MIVTGGPGLKIAELNKMIAEKDKYIQRLR